MSEGALVAKIGGDVKPFAAAVGEARKLASGFATSVDKSFGPSAFKGAIAGALTVGALTSKFTALLEKADHIHDASTAIGITAEQFQILDYAAKQTGTSVEGVGKALLKITLSQQSALKGNEGAIAKFASLGVTIADLRSKDPLSLFNQIGESLKGTAFNAKDLDASMALMGKSGKTAYAAMRDGITDATKKAKDLGLVLQNDVVEKLAETNKQMETLKRQSESLSARATVGAVKGVGDIGASVMRNSATGFAARVAGAMSGGEGFSDALVTAFLTGDFEATYKGADKERLKKRGKKVSAPKATSNGIGYFETLGNISFNGPNLTEAQRLGAYSRQNPNENRQLALLTRQVELLEKQLAEQKKIASKSSGAIDLIDAP